jgi:hypothetical protein
MRVADGFAGDVFRPELAHQITARIHSQHNSAVAKPPPTLCSRAGCQRAKSIRCRNFRRFVKCASAFAGIGLMRDRGANQRVFHTWTKSPFAVTPIAEFLMANTRHTELDGVLHHVLAERGAEAVAETGYAAAPLMRAVAHMLDGRPSPNSDSGAATRKCPSRTGAGRMRL